MRKYSSLYSRGFQCCSHPSRKPRSAGVTSASCSRQPAKSSSQFFWSKESRAPTLRPSRSGSPRPPPPMTFWRLGRGAENRSSASPDKAISPEGSGGSESRLARLEARWGTFGTLPLRSMPTVRASPDAGSLVGFTWTSAGKEELTGTAAARSGLTQAATSGLWVAPLGPDKAGRSGEGPGRGVRGGPAEA